MSAKMIVTLALAGLLATAGCSSTMTTTPAPSAPVSVDVASVDPATPVAVDPNVALRAQLRDWYSTVQGDLDTVTSDLGQMGTDARNQDDVSLVADCQVFGQDISTAQQDPTAPDLQVARSINSAMAAWASAANSCVNGDYATVSTYLNTGSSFMDEATARVKSLNSGG